MTCAANRMMVAIKRSTLPDVDVNSLSLNDPSCLLTYNATHVVGSMLFSNCGTTIEVTIDFVFPLHISPKFCNNGGGGGNLKYVSSVARFFSHPSISLQKQDEEKYIFFRNQIQTLRDPLKVVFRRNTVKIGFSCQFLKSATISSSYDIQKSGYIFSDSRVETFSYLFDVYTDGGFANKVRPSAFPVQVDFLQNIYLSLKAESGLANVILFLDSCKATPDDNPDNEDFYDLVKEG